MLAPGFTRSGKKKKKPTDGDRVPEAEIDGKVEKMNEEMSGT